MNSFKIFVINTLYQHIFPIIACEQELLHATKTI